jgi:mono/diheme cytochrome c family protein
MKPATRRIAKVFGLAACAAVVVAGAGVAWLALDRDSDPSAPDVQSSPALVVQGEYLARAADCMACHSTPGGRPFAGGVPFRLPFGTIYSSNITADQQNGIGTWSDDDFVRALHHGIAKDGTHLYPAFPYTSYTAMTRDDAVAIKAYLFSLSPVHTPAPQTTLSFPFNQRWTMAFWNLVFVDDHHFQSDPARTPQQNRGAYLATALGHCGECHTPRNLAFAVSNRRALAGTMVQGWLAGNITADRDSGVGDWSDQQLAGYLSTGLADERGSASGPMAEAVSNSLQYLVPADIAALVSYLRTVPPQPGTPGRGINLIPPVAMTTSTAWAPGPQDLQNGLGARIFEGACASCHQWNGQGQQTPYAALAGSQAVNDPNGTNLVQVLLAGADLRAVHRSAFMPGFAKAYTDQELAAVANYVIGHFGAKTGLVTPSQIHASRADQP